MDHLDPEFTPAPIPRGSWTPPIVGARRSDWRPRLSLAMLLFLFLIAGPASLLVNWVGLALAEDPSAIIFFGGALAHGVLVLGVVAATKRLSSPLAALLAIALIAGTAIALGTNLELFERATAPDATTQRREDAVVALRWLLLAGCAAIGSTLGWILAAAEEVLER